MQRVQLYGCEAYAWLAACMRVCKPEVSVEVFKSITAVKIGL